MLGGALSRQLPSVHEVYPLSSTHLDITSLQECRRVLSKIKPDWVLHTAAFTKVDEAESKAADAYRVNGLGTRNIAIAAEENGSRLVYYSTDYVFDGTRGKPYREWDQPNPLNEYGNSKLAGEFFVKAVSRAFLIIRTSWLFGSAPHSPPHFISKVLSQARNGKTLRMVNDQCGSPTFAEDLASTTAALMALDVRGIYHVTNSGSCSWFDFAREILKQAGCEVPLVPISTHELPLAARRPSYSVLDNFCLRIEGLPELRPWQEALADFMGTL